MKSFNVVCGLPRSGSTLLCNILNQNPEFHASSTSVVPQLMANMSAVLSNSPEVKAMLIREENRADARLVESMRAVIRAWYADQPKHVFDKGRGWAAQVLLLKQLFPNAQIVCTVRDLRSVMASIEKQHRQNPILDIFAEPLDKGIYARADAMFSPGGLIGSCIVGIEDLVRRNLPGVHFIGYELLSSEPENTMKELYKKFGLPPYAHDFDNVKNTSQDVDALYLNKFEHVGAGKVVPTKDDWKEYVSEDLAELILNRYTFYNQIFGYARPSRMNWNR